MNWSIITFGKYLGKNKTLPQILFSDPDYYFYCYTEGIFNNKGNLKHESEDLFKKATRIKIPMIYGTDDLAEYVIHPRDNKFAGVEVVEKTKPPHVGSSPTFRLPYFDMSVVKRLASYDKTGGKILVRDLKFYLFGESKKVITKKLIEDFFNDSSNFI